MVMKIQQLRRSIPDGFSEIRGEEGTGIYRFVVPGIGSGDLWTDWQGTATIYGFQSEESGKGLGRKTLQWLRQFFQDITVMDPGHQGSDSWEFWVKMVQEGLVQRLTDEDGLVDYP